MEAGLGTTNMVWEQACQYEASWVCINWNRLIYVIYCRELRDTLERRRTVLRQSLKVLE